MKRPCLFEGVVFAVIASITASALFETLTRLFSSRSVLELIITAISLAYIVYLLARSREKTGRIVVISTWAIIAAISWLLSLPLVLFVLIHVAMLWLVRSLYFYSSLLSALADLGLTGLSLAIAIWASIHTHSLFLSTWCFLLAQALFVVIPVRMTKQAASTTSIQEREDPFEHAHRSAETALRKLSSTH